MFQEKLIIFLEGKNWNSHISSPKTKTHWSTSGNFPGYGKYIKIRISTKIQLGRNLSEVIIELGIINSTKNSWFSLNVTNRFVRLNLQEKLHCFDMLPQLLYINFNKKRTHNACRDRAAKSEAPPFSEGMPFFMQLTCVTGFRSAIVSKRTLTSTAEIVRDERQTYYSNPTN